MKADEEKINVNMKGLEEAFKGFQDDIAGLDKDALPEEVNLKATAHVADIFESCKKVAGETLKFDKEELLPFISKNGELLQSSWRMENASDFANKVSMYVTKALEQIGNMAMAFGNPAEVKQAQKTIEIDKMQEQISNYADWKSNKIKSEVKASYGNLSEAVKSINEQISYLEKENSDIESKEKETIGALNSAMNALTEIRKKQFEQLKDAAGKAQADLSKAKKFERKEKAAA
jgi:hypothetical protein